MSETRTTDDALVMARYEYHRWENAERAATESRRLVLASLRAVREARGLGLRETARRAGVSAAALTQCETDERSTALGIVAIGRVLDVLTMETR